MKGLVGECYHVRRFSDFTNLMDRGKQLPRQERAEKCFGRGYWSPAFRKGGTQPLHKTLLTGGTKYSIPSEML